MADLPEITYKRSKRARRLSITVGSNGEVRVTVPQRIPMIVAKQFVATKQKWIIKHFDKAAARKQIYREGDLIGKSHTLHYKIGHSTVSSKISDQQILVRLPVGVDALSDEAQAEAQTAIARALRAEAKEYLPKRVSELADQFGFSYSQVRIKALRSRWGSCSRQRNINLNLFLMTLPNDLIDYVILHELVHTKVLNHGPKFWQLLEHCIPDAKAKAKQVKEHHPHL